MTTSRRWKPGTAAARLAALLIAAAAGLNGGADALAAGTVKDEPPAELRPPHDGGFFADGSGGVHKHRHRPRPEGRFGMSGLHWRNYMVLLAEKYAPGTVGDWRRTLAESERLTASLQARTRPSRHGREGVDAEKGHPLPSPDAGRILRPEAPLAGRHNGSVRPHADTHGGAARERWQAAIRAFDEAIVSGKPERIRAAMAGLLEQMKRRNAALERKLASGSWRRMS